MFYQRGPFIAEGPRDAISQLKKLLHSSTLLKSAFEKGLQLGK